MIGARIPQKAPWLQSTLSSEIEWPPLVSITVDPEFTFPDQTVWCPSIKPFVKDTESVTETEGAFKVVGVCLSDGCLGKVEVCKARPAAILVYEDIFSGDT